MLRFRSRVSNGVIISLPVKVFAKFSFLVKLLDQKDLLIQQEGGDRFFCACMRAYIHTWSEWQIYLTKIYSWSECVWILKKCLLIDSLDSTDQPAIDNFLLCYLYYLKKMGQICYTLYMIVLIWYIYTLMILGCGGWERSTLVLFYSDSEYYWVVYLNLEWEL